MAGLGEFERGDRFLLSSLEIVKRAIADSPFPAHPPSEAQSTEDHLLSSIRTVLVCQNRSCRKSGAAKVLAAFRQQSVPEVEVVGSGCLGECGNGPMVLTLPEKVWYSQVHPDEVATLVERHLRHGTPVQSMLYAKARSS